MTDSDTDIELPKEELSFLQSKMPCLFRRGVSPGVSPSDVTLYGYAITVNIQPTKKMNNRQWRKYDSSEQIKILGRLESALRSKNPTIKLKEIHYETCPKLKQIHFHALYEMPEIFVSTVEAYYDRLCGSTGIQTVPWRHLVVEQVYDRQGWLDYIRKDINKIK